MIVRKIHRFIEQEQLFGLKDNVLVGLSGGADSVALLRVLLHLGYKVEAAHCNFHLRGAESDRDAGFVQTLCREQNVLLHTIDFETRRYAADRAISVEMAARELRYSWFEQLSAERGLQKIAVAHHRDDSIETLLLNLIRGTGIAGLKGIRPLHGKIARPLLCVGREEVLSYLGSVGQDYVTDSSNLSEEFTRNKIRLSVLPLLETINPSVRKSLMQTATRLSETEAVYRSAIEQAIPRVFVPDEKEESSGMCGGSFLIQALLREPSPEALLYEILSPYGFVPSQIQDLFRALRGEPGRLFRAGEWVLLKDRDKVLLYSGQVQADLPEFSLQERPYDASFVLPKDPSVACIDAEKVKHPLLLRTPRKGDWFVPLGMKGRKLVSDYLTDRKKSLREKEQQLVLADGEQIVWLAGERLDNRYRVTADTKRLFLIRIKD